MEWKYSVAACTRSGTEYGNSSIALEGNAIGIGEIEQKVGLGQVRSHLFSSNSILFRDICGCISD